MDELSPLFEDVEFHERFRGYDQDEVDAYIDRLATAAAVMKGRMTELQARVEAAEARSGGPVGDGTVHEAEETLTRTLVLAQRTADAAIAEAREEADRLTSEAEKEADSTLVGARAEAQVTLRETQAEAAAILREAEEQAGALVADAESAAAAAAVVEQERLAREVAELQDLRAVLADDVEILERHLEEQRQQLAVSLSAINGLIESPEIFRTSRPPATSGVEVDPGLLAATSVEDEQADPVSPETDAVVELVDEENLDDEVVEAAGEVSPVISQYPAPTPFDQEGGIAQDPDDATEAEESDTSSVADPGDHAEEADDRTEAADFLRSREEFESVDEPASELVDLTEAASSVSAIDLESDGESVSAIDLESDGEPGTGGASAPGPVSPRLVTAADLDGSGVVATASVEDLDAAGPATAQIPLVEEASLFAETSAADEDPFLAQLRDAVAAGGAELDDDDALSAFFDQGPEEEGRSWFGRRR